MIRIKSRNDRLIRLTEERWKHIVESHGYMEGERKKVMETIGDPDYIVKGRGDELLALRRYEKTSISEKYTVVVYKEEDEEGFVLTAFMTSRGENVLRRGVLWRK